MYGVSSSVVSAEGPDGKYTTYVKYELSSDVSGYNSDLYADDDPRIFQFAHFVAYPEVGTTPTSAYVGSGGREVPDEFWYRRTVD